MRRSVPIASFSVFLVASLPQGTSREWDTAPRGEPATGVMSDWLKAGAVKGMNPPPTQPLK